jgi:osmotically-inducible protein OsmY
MMMSGSSSAGGVSASQGTTSAEASKDAALTDQIRRKYAAHAVLSESGIQVSTRNSVVRLSGSVPTYKAREDAEKLAISTSGVANVENRITVETSN